MIRALATLAVNLPRSVVRCRKCGGQLRGRIMETETVIICDHCEYFTAAPSTHRQLINDLIGEQLMADRRN